MIAGLVYYSNNCWVVGTYIELVNAVLNYIATCNCGAPHCKIALFTEETDSLIHWNGETRQYCVAICRHNKYLLITEDYLSLMVH